MRLKFCSLWTAALCPWVSEPCPPPPGAGGGREEEPGPGGAGLAFASLNPDQMGRRPHPLCSCHVPRPRSLGHLESWKGRGKSRISQPPSLLCRFSGDGGTGRSFQGWLRGTGRAETEVLCGDLDVLFSCTHPLTASSKCLWP